MLWKSQHFYSTSSIRHDFLKKSLPSPNFMQTAWIPSFCLRRSTFLSQWVDTDFIWAALQSLAEVWCPSLSVRAILWIMNYLRRGLAEQRWSLLAAGGWCPSKTEGEKNFSILLANSCFLCLLLI